MLVYGTDHSGINIENIEDYANASAIINLEESKSTESPLLTIQQPASFFRYAVNENSEVTSLDIISLGVLNIPIKPRNYINQLKLDVTLAGDKTQVEESSVILTGVANGFNLSAGAPFSNTDGKNELKAVNLSIEDFSTTFRLFGPVVDTKNEIIIDLVFTNGGQQRITLDVTAAMQTMSGKETAVKVTVPADIEIVEGTYGVITGKLKSWDFVYDELDVDITLPPESTTPETR